MDISEQEKQLLKNIRNWQVHTGEIPSYRKLMNLLGYKSPRSISMLLKGLEEKGYIERNGIDIIFNEEILEDESNAETVEVPLVGSIACGNPIIAKENVERLISVTTKLARPPYKYFILRAKGDSMNKKKIFDGSLVLIRQQETANNGDVVVAIINDDCTLKEFRRENNFILMIPQSTNQEHKPILLTDDFRVQGVMVMVLPEM